MLVRRMCSRLPGGGTVGGSKAVMTSPAAGATLSGASVTFTWSAGSGAVAYWLDVGSAQGQGNLFAQNVGLATSQTVNGIPTDGSTIYVKLWTLLGGAWQFNDLHLQGGGRKHQGSDNESGIRFHAERRQRHVHVERGFRRRGLLAGRGIGARPGKYLRAERRAGNQPDRERNSHRWKHGLREAVDTAGGTWPSTDYTYKAGGANAKAVMLLPSPTTVLGGASVTFTWSAGSGAAAYWLDLGSVQGQGNIFGQNVALATSQTVNGIPTDGSTVYVKLWTLLGGTWQFNDLHVQSGGRKCKGRDHESLVRLGIERLQRCVHLERSFRRNGLLAGCGDGARPGKYLRTERLAGNQ